jgi:hypothetical protein
MMEHVQGYKQQVLGGARDSGQGFVDDLKRRAMANPIPVAMIGAGIAWRFYRHPPVATLLVGAGVAMLMRGKAPTDPNAYRDPYAERYPGPYVPGGVAGYGYPVEASAPGTSTTERIGAAVTGLEHTAHDAAMRARDMAADAGSRLSEAAHRAASTVSDFAGRAGSAASDATDRATAAASDLVDRATSAASDLTDRATATASDLSGRASSAMSGVADRAGSLASGMTGGGASPSVPVGRQSYESFAPSDRMRSGGDRSSLSGIADAASSTLGSVADGARRQASSFAEMAQRNSVAVGVIGIVAGALLGRALRSTAAADGMASGAADAWSRGSRRVSSGLSGASDYARNAARTSRDYGSDIADQAADALGDAGEAVTSTGSDAASAVSRGASGAASGVAAAASRLADTATGALSSATGALSSATSAVSRGTSTAYRTAAGQAAYARRRAARATDGLPGEIANLAQSYPILLGTVGLALGAALGGSLRLSDSERDWMGPASDTLKARAKELAEQELGHVSQVVDRLGDKLQERVAAFGDTDGVPVGDSDIETVVGGRPEETVGATGQRAADTAARTGTIGAGAPTAGPGGTI